MHVVMEDAMEVVVTDGRSRHPLAETGIVRHRQRLRRRPSSQEGLPILRSPAFYPWGRMMRIFTVPQEERCSA